MEESNCTLVILNVLPTDYRGITSSNSDVHGSVVPVHPSFGGSKHFVVHGSNLRIRFTATGAFKTKSFNRKLYLVSSGRWTRRGL